LIFSKLLYYLLETGFQKTQKNDENEPKLAKNEQKRLKMSQKWSINVKKWIFTLRCFSISPTFPTALTKVGIATGVKANIINSLKVL
tara:strand:+ start:578 stop:838 length:261 start_codon:yes stop_codon:yes gene_type:complete